MSVDERLWADIEGRMYVDEHWRMEGVGRMESTGRNHTDGH
jgi:hypothetical protein